MSETLVAALWYLGRGSGVAALVLFTVTTTLGVATRRGRPAFGLARFVLGNVHRDASLLAVAFLAIHVGALLFDPYAQLRFVDLVVPFMGAYEPFWLGLGTLALDLVVALVATSLLRSRMPLRAWRWLHLSAYAMWPIALAHGLGTGSDTSAPWLLAVCATCAAAAGVWRLTTAADRDRRGLVVPR